MRQAPLIKKKQKVNQSKMSKYDMNQRRFLIFTNIHLTFYSTETRITEETIRAPPI